MELDASIVRLQLAETFVIAREAHDEDDVVQVELRHDGHVGRGEAAPIERYDETPESALAFVEEHAALLGDDPFALEEIGARLREIPGEHAAKAALDAALHDLQGKLLGVPVWRLLGLPRVGPPTSWTIWLGDPDDMARRTGQGRRPLPAAQAQARRRRRPRRRARPRRPRAHRRCRCRSTSTSGGRSTRRSTRCRSSPSSASRTSSSPCPPAIPAGPELKRRSPIPIYVDEDCHTLADVAECAEFAHGINVKLAKSGGIREAIRMAHAARALGLGVMLGCMVESGLGIAAGCVVAPLCDHVDLDGNLLLARRSLPRSRVRRRRPGALGGAGARCRLEGC